MSCLDRFKPESQDAAIIYDKKGYPVVYGRRWCVLMAYAMSFFAWNVGALRYVPLVPEFALFFNTTNEFNIKEREVGVDFLLILDSICLVVLYPFAGVLIDTYGLKLVTFGSIGQAISFWWWYLSGDNFTSALISRAIGNAFGLLFSTALLRITMIWFPAYQRPLAVGVGVIFTELGSGAGLLLGDFFKADNGERHLELSLKSCKQDFRDAVIDTIIFTEGVCTELAEEAFCCSVDANIELLNLVIAIIGTVITLFTILSIREKPPTPPSVGGGASKKAPGLWLGLKLMFGNRNYAQLCLADFLAAGPVLALVSFLSRVFPPSVAPLYVVASAAGIAAAIPLSFVFSQVVSRTKWYYELCALGYVSGFLCWGGATVCLVLGTPASERMFLFFIALALNVFLIWTIATYELKSEYVFNTEYHLEGYIVAVDRFIIALSAVVFIAAIPPERIEGEKIPGRVFTFFTGFFFMLLGIMLVLTIKDKRNYKRKAFEDKGGNDDDDPLHVTPEDFEPPLEVQRRKSMKHQQEEEAAALAAEKIEVEPAKANIPMTMDDSDGVLHDKKTGDALSL